MTYILIILHIIAQNDKELKLRMIHNVLSVKLSHMLI